MIEKRYIIRGIWISYLQMFVGIIFSFLLTPIKIRYLGQYVYGLWVTLGSAVGYLGLFNFGMSTATIKYTAEYHARNEQEILNKTISSILVVFILIGIFIILICAGLTPFLPHIFNLTGDLVSVGKIVFLIMGLNLVLGLLGNIFGNIIYGYQRVDIRNTYSIIQGIANALLVITLLRLGFGIIGLAIASLLSILIVSVLYLLFIHHSNYGIIIHPRLVDFKIFKEIVPYSIRSFVLGLTTQICFKTDNIVIGALLLVSLVTPYSVAYHLCFTVTTLIMKIPYAIFPTFTKLYTLKDINSLRSLFLKTVKISVAIFVPFAVFIAIFGHSFINLWVGEENYVGTSVLLVLIFINFLHAFAGPAGAILQGIGKNKEIMYSNVVMAVLNLMLSIIMAQKIGLIGVALGTLIAHLCTASWLGPLMVYKYTGLRVKKFFLSGVLPPFLAGIPTGVITWIFIKDLFPNNNLFYLGFKGAMVIIIFAVIYLTICTTKEERQMYFGLLLRIDRKQAGIQNLAFQEDTNNNNSIRK